MYLIFLTSHNKCLILGRSGGPTEFLTNISSTNMSVRVVTRCLSYSSFCTLALSFDICFVCKTSQKVFLATWRESFVYGDDGIPSCSNSFICSELWRVTSPVLIWRELLLPNSLWVLLAKSWFSQKFSIRFCC